MVDTRAPRSGDAADRGSGPPETPRRPRWVVTTGVVLGFLFIGFAILHVTTGGALGQH